jgi:asparagine synthase (glutamine-hydrolysing)
MCGISCVVGRFHSLAEQQVVIERMTAALQHRGPDEGGAYRDARAGLGHARLSIIDLTTGQQPLSNEDGTLWIVFNGEIFNYLELRAELETLGHRFRTRSDTEVIVHAWEAWGEDAFRRFNGQWAVALWDRRSATLVLSRDPVGILPLCYCEHGGRLYFASEAKALFAADRGIHRAFDPRGLAEVFTFWSALPPRTVFAGVAELEPGHVVEVSPVPRDQHPTGSDGRGRDQGVGGVVRGRVVKPVACLDLRAEAAGLDVRVSDDLSAHAAGQQPVGLHDGVVGG